MLADEMSEMVSIESQRQGAWVVLKEKTGAHLLCPATGSVLSREDIIGEPSNKQEYAYATNGINLTF